MNDCIFCEIVAGESPAYKVYEDAQVLAFLDTRPVATGHTLLIPKAHARNVLAMTGEATGQLFTYLPALANQLKETLDATGMQIFLHNEPSAHQVVMHTHIHLVPTEAGVLLNKNDLTAVLAQIKEV